MVAFTLTSNVSKCKRKHYFCVFSLLTVKALNVGNKQCMYIIHSVLVYPVVFEVTQCKPLRQLAMHFIQKTLFCMVENKSWLPWFPIYFHWGKIKRQFYNSWIFL